MYWTLELASALVDAPWEGGISKSELIDYAENHGVPLVAIENLYELENGDDLYYGLEDLWPDMPTSDADFGFDPDEY